MISMCNFTYVLRIQRVALDAEGGYQVRIALQGDRQLEFIPAYQTAFAAVLPLKQVHHTTKEAVGERDALLAWLESHTHGMPDPFETARI
jgi:hypothetical protein